MKKHSSLLDIVLLFGLGLISFLAISPEALGMPSSMQMTILVAVLVLVATFLVFLWREKPVDEREAHNQAQASRLAYIIGSITLIIGLVVQSLDHEVDPVVPIALLAMIATKILVQRGKDQN